MPLHCLSDVFHYLFDTFSSLPIFVIALARLLLCFSIACQMRFHCVSKACPKFPKLFDCFHMLCWCFCPRFPVICCGFAMLSNALCFPITCPLLFKCSHITLTMLCQCFPELDQCFSIVLPMLSRCFSIVLSMIKTCLSLLFTGFQNCCKRRNAERKTHQ